MENRKRPLIEVNRYTVYTKLGIKQDMSLMFLSQISGIYFVQNFSLTAKLTTITILMQYIVQYKYKKDKYINIAKSI